MHPILIFQYVRSVKTVFSPTTRNDAIVGAVTLPRSVAQGSELLLSFDPVNFYALLLGKTAGITDPLLVKRNGGLERAGSVLELYRRIRSLVRDDAFLAVFDFPWQTVQGVTRTLTFKDSFVDCRRVRDDIHLM
jgi:hypothetical protein